MRLLLIEDETRLAEVTASALKRAGFVVDCAADLGEASAALKVVGYDAIVLDLGLPDGDGMSLLSEMRDHNDATPVLILTARDGLDVRVDGLNAGADDYLLKPFAVPELVARLKALLRRPSGVLGLHLKIGNISFDTTNREVMVGGEPMVLSRRELALLEHLMRRAGRVVAKSLLEDSIYGFDDEIGSNSLEVMVHRLRKKLLARETTASIHTVRGVGYILAEQAP